MFKNKYKIDVNVHSSTNPFALYLKRPSFFSWWEYVGSFQTKEEARLFHQQIADLPIYLSSLLNRRNHP